MDGSTFAGIASSLSSATTLARAMLGMKIDDEVRDAVSKIQSDLVVANSAVLVGLAERAELLENIDKLKNDLREKTNWDNVSSKYALKEFPTGAQVYVLKETTEGEIEHKLCPNCFQNREKRILQSTSDDRGGEYVQCLKCEAKLTLVTPRPPQGSVRGLY